MIREITIRPVLNGYRCQVGCQEVVFQSRNALLIELGRYLEYPRAVEGEYLRQAVNPMPPAPTSEQPMPALGALHPSGMAQAQQLHQQPENAPTPNVR